MNKYLFKTSACMKPYNKDKWWVMDNLIPQKLIEAESLDDALKSYQEITDDEHSVVISDNALKTKEPMYRDICGKASQVGYVITASTEFFDDKNNKYCKQYIELWVEVLTIVDTKF